MLTWILSKCKTGTWPCKMNTTVVVASHCVILSYQNNAEYCRKGYNTCRRKGGELIKMRWSSGCACRCTSGVRLQSVSVFTLSGEDRGLCPGNYSVSAAFHWQIFLRFCSLGEMGPHSVVMCIAELQENSQHQADEHTNKMESRNTAEYEQWRRSVKG